MDKLEVKVEPQIAVSELINANMYLVEKFSDIINTAIIRCSYVNIVQINFVNFMNNYLNNGTYTVDPKFKDLLINKRIDGIQFLSNRFIYSKDKYSMIDVQLDIINGLGAYVVPTKLVDTLSSKIRVDDNGYAFIEISIALPRTIYVINDLL